MQDRVTYTKYKYELLPDDLRASNASTIKKLVEANFIETGLNELDKGLESLNIELKRNYCLNHHKLKKGITIEELQKEFPGKDEFLLRHFTTNPCFYGSFYLLADEFRRLFNVNSIGEDIRNKEPESTNVFDIYKKDEEIYFKTITKVPLKTFSEVHKFQRKEEATETVFKLTENGFQLVYIATHSPFLRALLMGDKGEVERQHAVLRLSRWERFKQKWQAMSLGAKMVAGFSILAGIAAVLLGVFFPPSLAVTVPLLGKLTAGTLLTYGGAVLAGVTALGHTAHILTTPLPQSGVVQQSSSEKQDEEKEQDDTRSNSSDRVIRQSLSANNSPHRKSMTVVTDESEAEQKMESSPSSRSTNSVDSEQEKDQPTSPPSSSPRKNHFNL